MLYDHGPSNQEGSEEFASVAPPARTTPVLKDKKSKPLKTKPEKTNLLATVANLKTG